MNRRRRAPDRREGHRLPRVNELLREIVAEELDRLDDERLSGVTVTGVSSDREMQTATVYYTCYDGDDDAAEVVAALDERRARLQRSIADQSRLRRTPVLRFSPDTTLRGAQRIDDILRGLDDGP